MTSVSLNLKYNNSPFVFTSDPVSTCTHCKLLQVWTSIINFHDEFCMFLLNIEVFNIMTPDFPYTSENETKCTILYFCMFYFHLYTANIINKYYQILLNILKSHVTSVSLSLKRKKNVFINPWYSYTLLHCYYDILYMCCTQKKLVGDFFRL
jgi:hypothetical protein